MNSNDMDIKSIKDFIFNDDVQHILSSINDNLMDFNILEITGMGNQEIKHSNILGWLFDDSEHNLEYHILDNFLKKVIEENRKEPDNKPLDNLQSYIYLSEKKKEITIYREKDNIDLLIVDEANKVIITIENKVYASERRDGKDGGQLKKYENIINQKYDNEYEKYFIFLTIDLEEPSKGNEKWMIANHQMVTDVIEEILKTKIDITIKTKIILESYVDILKRNGIVADEKLKILCKKIWDNPEYKKALEIINNYKPDIFNEISLYLQEKLGEYDSIELDYSTRSYIRFKSKSWDCDEQREGNGWTSTKNVLLYEFQNKGNKLVLVILIGPMKTQTFREKIFNLASNNKKIFKPGKKLNQKFNQIWSKAFISEEDINKDFEELKKIIDRKLENFFNNNFDKNNAILDEVMKKPELTSSPSTSDV